MFPETFTATRLQTFWRSVRKDAGLLGIRLHDRQHSNASHELMRSVGLTTVGRLLGHSLRETTAIYAHIDDDALYDAAAQAAVVIMRAVGDRAPVEHVFAVRKQAMGQFIRTIALSRRARRSTWRTSPSISGVSSNCRAA